MLLHTCNGMRDIHIYIHIHTSEFILKAYQRIFRGKQLFNVITIPLPNLAVTVNFQSISIVKLVLNLGVHLLTGISVKKSMSNMNRIQCE